VGVKDPKTQESQKGEKKKQQKPKKKKKTNFVDARHD
jgi:hypothetical protein